MSGSVLAGAIDFTVTITSPGSEPAGMLNAALPAVTLPPAFAVMLTLLLLGGSVDVPDLLSLEHADRARNTEHETIRRMDFIKSPPGLKKLTTAG